jgi:hypothetical protein
LDLTSSVEIHGILPPVGFHSPSYPDLEGTLTAPEVHHLEGDVVSTGQTVRPVQVTTIELVLNQDENPGCDQFLGPIRVHVDPSSAPLGEGNTVGNPKDYTVGVQAQRLEIFKNLDDMGNLGDKIGIHFVFSFLPVLPLIQIRTGR